MGARCTHDDDDDKRQSKCKFYFSTSPCQSLSDPKLLFAHFAVTLRWFVGFVAYLHTNPPPSMRSCALCLPQGPHPYTQQVPNRCAHSLCFSIALCVCLLTFFFFSLLLLSVSCLSRIWIDLSLSCSVNLCIFIDRKLNYVRCFVSSIRGHTSKQCAYMHNIVSS